MKYITILSIAGSDCSGGAGIQADIKTASALGCYATTAITAVTVQNTLGVSDVHPIPASVVKAQIEAVTEDISPAAIKIGMLTDAETIHAIAEVLHPLYEDCPIILDPVMVSSSGRELLHPEAVECLKKELIPLCFLVTPNIPETEILSGIRIRSMEKRLQAAHEILKSGCRNVLIKGGHAAGDDMADLLVCSGSPRRTHLYHAVKIETPNTHGTGCTLSTAIACFTARDYKLPRAVKQAKQYLTRAMEAGSDVEAGYGHGPLNHLFNPKKLIVQ